MTSRKNFFVVGDLIVDHAVFVETPDYPYQSVPGETTYKVVRRQNTAGGAANTARILSALYPDGKTYLWGILGSSNWGTFRKILEDSQALDGVFNNIELRGVQDETNAPINTITRLVLMEKPMPRVLRFDDAGHTHVPDAKRETLRYHLERINDKHPLNAVIINDLDRGCMTQDLVSQIAKFTTGENIPLFVDPKRDREKYRNIKGTAILPNLSEWCHLVNEPEENTTRWRQNLDNSAILEEMAEKSFHYLGNFQYHIIKCDKDGAVIIAPKPDTRNRYAIYRALPIKAKSIQVKDPLGPGDVMTGVIAAEYNKEVGTQSLLQAFHKANITIACFREMPYQRMPSNTVVGQRQDELKPWQARPIAETTMGHLFLPKEEKIRERKLKTEVPDLLSINIEFKQQVKRLIDSLRNVDSSTLRSIMLAAPSGSGKSLIAKHLRGKFGADLGLTAFKIELEEVEKNFDGTLEKIYSAHPGKHVLFIIDEALKGENAKVVKSRERMVYLLNKAEQKRIRFLFMDALFCEKEHLSLIDDEIQSRWDPHILSGLAERPEDIAHIMGGYMWKEGKKKGICEVAIERNVLQSVINHMLMTNSNIRSLGEIVKEIYSKAIVDHKGGSLIVKHTHCSLPLSSTNTKRRVSPEKYIYEE